MEKRRLKLFTLFILLFLIPLIVIVLKAGFDSISYGFYSINKIVFLSPIIYRIFFYKKSLKKSITEGFNFNVLNKNLLKIISIGIILSSIYMLTFIILRPYLDISTIESSLRNISYTDTNIFYVGFYIIFFNSLLEEFFWRGFMFKEIAKFTNNVISHILTAIGFALTHFVVYFSWFNLQLHFIAATGFILFTVIMNLIFQKYKDLFSCWFIHIFVTMVQILIAFSIFKVI